MNEERHERIIASEKSFFAQYYDGAAYSPAAWQMRFERELAVITQHVGLDGTGKVLSLGCGDGLFEIMLSAHVSHVTGVDLAPKAIELARRNARAAEAGNVRFECAPIADIVWKTSFDAVICLALLHHIPSAETDTLMDQIFRHLSPGGWFYAQDPNVHAVLRKVGRVLMGKRYDRYHSPDERELDPAELRKAVRAHGFRDVKTGCIDFTLIPSSYLWPRGPRWFFRLCTLVDRTLCRSPLSRWPSGFYLFARK